MNDDLISRQAAIDALGEEPYVWTEDDEFAQGTRYQWKNGLDEIEALPSADAVPVRHGKWLWLDGVRCSQCNYKLATTGLPSYCPNCGARMDEE